MEMNVLIIEDESELANEIAYFLGKEGYVCEIAKTGAKASDEIFVNEYDFFLLDIGLPDLNGLDLIEEINKYNPEAAILIISAHGEVNDKIKGLDNGADDYISKPFSLLELSSRMHAVYRRKKGFRKNTIQIKGFVIDIHERTITFNSTLINLTKKEFDIISYLVLNTNKVITRMQLSEHIWGNIVSEESDSNYIDVHVKNLRKKISAYSQDDLIIAVRGIGYKIDTESVNA